MQSGELTLPNNSRLEFGSRYPFQKEGCGMWIDLRVEVHRLHNGNESMRSFFIGQSMDPGNEDQMQSERKGLRSRQVWNLERMM